MSKDFLLQYAKGKEGGVKLNTIPVHCSLEFDKETGKITIQSCEVVNCGISKVSFFVINGNHGSKTPPKEEINTAINKFMGTENLSYELMNSFTVL